MNPQYDKNLETRIDRVLKGLPELAAPSSLAPRVVAALAARRALPWYRQPWPRWPVALRVATLVFLLASCGGLCVAIYELTKAAGFTLAMQEVSQTFSAVASLWNTINALLSAIVLVIKHLGTGFIL